MVTYNTYSGIVGGSINAAHVCEMYSFTGENSPIQIQVSDMQGRGKVAAWSSSESHLDTTFLHIHFISVISQRMF